MARVSLILTPGFADWEYAFIAGTGSAFYGIDVRFFAPATGEFRSQGGLAVTVDGTLQQCLDWNPDVVAVIGGMIWESADAPHLRDFLHASRSGGAIIAGICGGTLALARAGLYTSSPAAVAADRIITAPGTAAVSFTCAVFEGAGLSTEIIAQFRSMLAAEHE